MKEVTHTGTVIRSANGQVQVRITQISGCATCAAHGKCGFAESKEKELTVTTPQWQQYKEGDPVVVTIRTGLGLQAVIIAYIAPAALLLATFTILHYNHLSDTLCALLSLAIVVLYCGILYLLRHHLQHKFELKLTPSQH